MKTITVQKFCLIYDVSSSFIDSLSKFELIEIIEIDNSKHVYINDIRRIEKMKRLHFDLNVNFESLDIINHLTDQIQSLQNELNELKNKIDFYK